MMTFNYSKFFSVELLHEYFANQKCSGLEIVPAEDCVQIMKRTKMQPRFIDNKLVALIEENDQHEPVVNSEGVKSFHKYYDKSVFRFYIRATDPLFYNYTNIDILASSKKFYFSNLAGNSKNGFLFLTRPLSSMKPGAIYTPGRFIKDDADGTIYEAVKKSTGAKKNKLTDNTTWAPKGLAYLTKKIDVFRENQTYLQGDMVKKKEDGDIYESLKKHTSAKPDELNDATLWVKRGRGQLEYPSENDIVDCCGGTYLFSLSQKITKAVVEVFSFNYKADKPGYDVSAAPAVNLEFKTPVDIINVSLSGLEAGLYCVKVNNESRMVYVDVKLNTGNILGIIEIFNCLKAEDDYALLADDEKLVAKSYQIQFPNRRVLWKFTRKDGKAKSIVDTSDEYAFKLVGDDFVSETPIPLSQTVLKTLKLEFKTNDFAQFPLPNPGIRYLEKYNADDYDYLCSSLHLNY